MGISISTRQAYSEIDSFLNVISLENRERVPKYLRDLFYKEKDESYIKEINPDVPIKNQGLKDETLAIIAWLNLEYWCQDENEKRRLTELYEQNEKKKEALVQIAFNPDKVFKSKEQIIVNIPTVKQEETIIKRIINKLKRIFLK